jgi:hypothetical protein
VLDRSAKRAERWTKLASLELREFVQSLVQQIQMGEAKIAVWLNRTAIVSSVMPDAAPVPKDGAAKAIDDGLASLIARATASRNLFLTGRDDSIDAMASRLGVRRDYLGKYRDYSGDHKNRKYAAVSRGFVG